MFCITSKYYLSNHSNDTRGLPVTVNSVLIFVTHKPVNYAKKEICWSTYGHLIREVKDSCSETYHNNKSKKDPETKIDAGINCVLQVLIMHNADYSRLKKNLHLIL